MPVKRKTRATLDTLAITKDGKFLLQEVSCTKVRAKLAKSAHWSNVGNDTFQTDDLGAAAAYRECANDHAEKVFNRLFQTHYALPKLPPLPGLDPHQLEGLKWCLHRKRSYLAHAPGAGKTAVAILLACIAQGSGQSIFVVPPGLALNWENEILKFTAWLGVWPAVGIVGRSDTQDRVAWRADFLIVPDSMLSKAWVYDRLQKIKKKVVAVDEASRFKDPVAERSIAFYGGTSGGQRYAGIYQTARHVVFMDGSPMPNRPIELWAPTYALHPQAIDCKSYDDFGYRYCGAKPNERGQWEYLYSSHEEELKRKLQNDFMHVVMEDQLTNPDRLRRMVWMDQDVRTAEYRDWQAAHIPPRDFAEHQSEGEVARFRKELGMRKVQWVADYVAQRLYTKSESILLFAWHRHVVEALVKALAKWKPRHIYGKTPPEMRERAIAEFQSGKCQLLILNIATAGRGYNLQRANRVVFAEWSWTDELNKQCEHRAARRGSEEFIIPTDYIVAPYSLDHVTLRAVFSKQKRVKRIIG